ncbi:MAG: dihydrofolate reductase [Butyrivibrio sp.]|nr:dihydrofolate reductase [Butyrivibrio sp.]
MKLIVAVDENWGIGNKGQLLVSIPADHKMFRKETLGKVVVLGRKTLETFPQGQPLDNRTNIILSRKKDYSVRNALIVHDRDELLKAVEKYDTNDVYIIGGASVYEQFLDLCDTAIVTHLDREYVADAFIPNLDKSDDWMLETESEEQVYFDTTYTFRVYKRK